jgi:hypothetical protein
VEVFNRSVRPSPADVPLIDQRTRKGGTARVGVETLKSTIAPGAGASEVEDGDTPSMGETKL